MLPLEPVLPELEPDELVLPVEPELLPPDVPVLEPVVLPVELEPESLEPVDDVLVEPVLPDELPVELEVESPEDVSVELLPLVVVEVELGAVVEAEVAVCCEPVLFVPQPTAASRIISNTPVRGAAVLRAAVGNPGKPVFGLLLGNCEENSEESEKMLAWGPLTDGACREKRKQRIKPLSSKAFLVLLLPEGYEGFYSAPID